MTLHVENLWGAYEKSTKSHHTGWERGAELPPSPGVHPGLSQLARMFLILTPGSKTLLDDLMLVSTAPSRSSPATGSQSNNRCQMHVTLATISVATGEAAAPTRSYCAGGTTNSGRLKRNSRLQREKKAKKSF